jgi:hypothetical protein
MWGVLALLVILGAHLWGELPDSAGLEPAAKAGWSVATRSYPAFAVSQFDLYVKTDTYEIYRHPEGGRKDVLRWSAQDEKPVAELGIYRPGGESEGSGPAIAEIAARMNSKGWRELEAAGVIESKFGRSSCFAWRSTRTMRRPVLASSGARSKKHARRPPIGCLGKMLVSMQLFVFDRIIMMRCGPIDLVTICPRRLE